MYLEVLKKNFLIIFLIFIISFTFNWYIGLRGFNVDSFTYYQTGQSILNKQIPFKDYWVSQGIIIDIIQSFFFKISGVNWKSYLLHSSSINSFFAISIFLFFRKYGLAKLNSFIYSVSTSLIFYPQVGTPFGDFSSTFFSILALFSFLLALKFKSFIFWFSIPIFIFCGFLSKQTPAVYFLIIISFFIIYNFFLEKNYKDIIYLILSSLICIFILSVYLISNQIEFDYFYDQYIKFSSTVGKHRMSLPDAFLQPLSFSRYFLKFKLLHISSIILIFIFIKNLIKNKNFFKSKDFISIFLILFSVYSLIFHQMLTLSLKFVYFYIPIILGFTNIFFLKYSFFDKRKFNLLTLSILFISLLYYLPVYIFEQKFKLSCGKNHILEKAIKTKIIDNKTNIYWISCNNPAYEVKNVYDISNFLNKKFNESINYALITDYKFIFSNLENKNVFPLNQWHNPGISYPINDQSGLQSYKVFLLNKLKKNKIKYFVFTYPSLYGFNNYLEYKKIFISCLKEEQKILEGSIYLFNVENCY